MIIGRAPVSVQVGGKRFPIRTNFRIWVQFERLLTDNTVPDDEKAAQMFSLLFPTVPGDLQKAAEGIVWFWQCGMEHGGGAGGRSAKIYDYELDAPYLYAAFMADYGMDIESKKSLHWWKFRALMMNLKPDNLFCRILDYRGADISKKKGEERKHYEKMRQYYALPVSADEREKKDIIMTALCGDGDVEGALRRAGML